MMDDDVRAPYTSAVRQAEVIEFQAQADLSGFIEQHRRGFSGKPKDSRGMDDVVRELHGQPTGNARAKTFAGAVTDVYDKLRLRFNAAGGDYGNWPGHGLVPSSDPPKDPKGGNAARGT